MTDEDYDFDAQLEKREALCVARDDAETARKLLDDEMKGHLALRDGKYQGPLYAATLVDRTTTTYDHDGIRKGLLMAGVGMDVILEVFEKNKKTSQSSSIQARRVG